MSMKGEIINRSTVGSQASHPQLNLSQISAYSMTSEQRKLHERGLYFPEEILLEALVQLSKGDQLWTQPFLIQLSTQSFGQIPLSLITKIKLYHGNEEGIVTLKIMVKKEIFLYKLGRKDAFEVFSKVVWGRLATMNLFPGQELEGKKEVDGIVYKRTEYLKCWEVRTLKVSKEGLKVFKGGKEQICQRIEKTSEIWTRFDTIKQERYLVVKLWRGTTKEEIAIPIQNAMTWLHALCHLLG